MGVTRGLSKIEYGTPVSGGVATSWTEIGYVDADSTANITQADSTETVFTAANADDPIDKDVTPGARTMVFSLLDSDPDKLVILFGGTVTGSGSSKVWKAPRQAVTIEKSWKITPKKGQIITIPRGQLSAKINHDMQKTGKFVVDISVAVLLPEDGTTEPISVGPTVS